MGLALFMLMMVVWSGTYSIRWLVSDLEEQFFWLDMTYLGVVAVPFCTSIFALQFTHRSHLLTRRNVILLAVVPVLTLIVLWTDDFHGLFYGGLRSPNRIIVGGPWFWFNAYYSYGVYFVMVILIFWEFLGSANLYRQQIFTILAGMLLPYIGSLISMSGQSPFADLDITPFVFIFSGGVIAFGLFRYRLMDLVPVAQHRLIESLPDGVLVVDRHLRIVDINPAAQAMLKCSDKVIGALTANALAEWPLLGEIMTARSGTWVEIQLSKQPAREVDVRATPLFDRMDKTGGLLVVLRDITDRKLMEEKLKQLSIHDGLTGLYNRGFFEEELVRLERGRRFPISLILADVDNLKEVNDSSGHAAGDEILKRAAQVLSSAFRAEDVITRIGGDEFVVILPNTDAAAVEAALLRVRQAFSDHNEVFADFPVRISFGTSTADINMPLAEALKNADAEMYREKKARRGEVNALRF